MNILITGINGLLGKKLAYSLADNNIYAIVRDIDKTAKNFSDIVTINQDLAKLNTDKLPSNIDVIYYLAQSDRFRDFPDGAMDVMEVNIRAPLKIIDWAIKNNVKKFFYASSGGIYTNPQKPINEFLDINANEKKGFYLDSKLASEILIRNYASYFETFAILRPFFIYGPEQNPTMLIPRLINNIQNGKEILLYGKNGIKVNPIYVDDAAIAFKNLLNLEGEFLFNIAGNEIISIKELSEIIGEIVNTKPVFTYSDNNQSDLIANTNLMKKLLHIPQWTLENGIIEILKNTKTV